jgi:claudin
MITAIGLGFLGILLSVLGMKCTSVGAGNHKAKARTALLGGLLLGVAGKFACFFFHWCNLVC